MMTEPYPHGTCFIVHDKGDRTSTWSKAFRFCGSAEEFGKLVLRDEGRRSRISLEITKYVDGEPEKTHEVKND